MISVIIDVSTSPSPSSLKSIQKIYFKNTIRGSRKIFSISSLLLARSPATPLRKIIVCFVFAPDYKPAAKECSLCTPRDQAIASETWGMPSECWHWV